MKDCLDMVIDAISAKINSFYGLFILPHKTGTSNAYRMAIVMTKDVVGRRGGGGGGVGDDVEVKEEWRVTGDWRDPEIGRRCSVAAAPSS
jgi:hypothetical protein